MSTTHSLVTSPARLLRYAAPAFHTARRTIQIVLYAALLLAIVLGAAPAAALSQAQPAAISAASLLNPDGTLRLDGAASGAINLSGWNVSLDPQRGPVFAPALAPAGEWDNVGSSGLNNGSLSGQVNAIAISGTDVYVGGNFTNVNNGGTSLPEADYIAKWDGTNWSALGSNGAGNGSLNNSVFAIAISGTDVYVGGGFTNVNNNGTSLTAADFVAKWNGSAWSALGSNGASNGSLGFSVYTIAISGTDVYVGGLFLNVNNGGTSLTAADYIAKWDGTNWSALGSDGAGNGSLNNTVFAIAISGTDVYVGGLFTDVNNGGTILTAADRIAKWTGTNWSSLGSNGASNGSLNSTVYAIAISGADVYVGGAFTNVNNNGTSLTAADYVAKWNGSAWSALGSNGASNGSLSATVYAIAISGTDVYVGGNFTNVNNAGTSLPEADRIAKWDGTSWSALGSDGAGNGAISGVSVVNAIAVNGTDVYAGGAFDNGGSAPTADYIGKWNGSAWSALGSNGVVEGSFTPSVRAIAVSGTNVYVGGSFTNVLNNGTVLTAADYIAKWDGSNWSALGSNGAGNGSLNYTVRAIAINGTDVYVGGVFSDVNNAGTSLPEADYIAKWDGSNWSALGSNGAGGGSLNDIVRDIAVSGTDVYVGGAFADVNNGGTSLPEADYIAKWNGSAWSALGSNGAGNGSLNNGVEAIAVSGTNVYVGGNFANVNNAGTSLTAADRIAKWDGTNWSALGSNGAGNGSLNYRLCHRHQRDGCVCGRQLYECQQWRDLAHRRRLHRQMGRDELVRAGFERRGRRFAQRTSQCHRHQRDGCLCGRRLYRCEQRRDVAHCRRLRRQMGRHKLVGAGFERRERRFTQ
ncbi:hypothetical protein [Candidatus Amarolinea dominans]|uniref:hypothetical protein n=1 Tax=Candidatus Amarolinea dominans TaxID=3140696 RepID=UPI003135EEE1|nr:hypothetical protein [Anaerolineae bacterium]